MSEPLQAPREPQPTDPTPASAGSTTEKRRAGKPPVPGIPTNPERGGAAEAEIWQGRTRVAHFAGRFLVFGLVCTVAVVGIVQAANRTDWLDWKSAILAILAMTFVAAIVILGTVVVRVLGTRYRITSQRIFIHRGLLSQTIDQTELIRVDDVRIYKTVVDRLFGLGTVGIVSSDFSDGELRIDGVAKPEEVAEAVRSSARTLRQRAMYVESI